MANYLVTDSQLTSVADAIRAKTGANGGLSFPSGMATAIGSISTGTSTSVQEKDVNFIDYDGTIVASYTAQEAQALTALPANPTHTGLTSQGWNWSLADIKSQLTNVGGKVWVGQMYVTTSGDTEIDVVMQEGRLSPILTIAVNGTITIDWGDETSPDTVTGTSLTTSLDPTHTYASGGSYTIKISETLESKYSFFVNTNSYAILRKNTTQNQNKVYANCVQRIRLGTGIPTIDGYAFYSCYSLASITIPSSVNSIGSNAFSSCYSLASITIPSGVTSIGNSAFSGCYSLASITIPSSMTSIGNSMFSSCYSLASITIPSSVESIVHSAFSSCGSLASITIPSNVTSIGNSTFSSCSSLASITIPSSVESIGNSAFSSCYGVAEYHLQRENVPTGGATMFYNIVSDCVIYVPYSADHSVLNAYGTTTNWATYADYMKEEGANGITWAEWQALNA